MWVRRRWTDEPRDAPALLRGGHLQLDRHLSRQAPSVCHVHTLYFGPLADFGAVQPPVPSVRFALADEYRPRAEPYTHGVLTHLAGPSTPGVHADLSVWIFRHVCSISPTDLEAEERRGRYPFRRVSRCRSNPGRGTHVKWNQGSLIHVLRGASRL